MVDPIGLEPMTVRL